VVVQSPRWTKFITGGGNDSVAPNYAGSFCPR
jgi:hypothetical protein